MTKREFLAAGAGFALAAGGRAFAQQGSAISRSGSGKSGGESRVQTRKAKTTKLFKSPPGFPNGLAITPEGLWIGEQKMSGKWYTALTSVLPPPGQPPPPPPPGTTYLSNLNWTIATNGNGPVEKDKSSGEAGANDGRCETTGQPGWAADTDADCTAAAPFAPSTWTSGALNPGGSFTGRPARLSVNYGTNGALAGWGFHFDDVVLGDFEEALPDAQACPAPGLNRVSPRRSP